MTGALVVVIGIVILVVVAVCVGASLDTEAQRREWQRVAEARRTLRPGALGLPDSMLCEHCPYRNAGA